MEATDSMVGAVDCVTDNGLNMQLIYRLIVYECRQTASGSSTSIKKADIVGITYGLISKLVLRIAKTKTDANHRLFQLYPCIEKEARRWVKEWRTNTLRDKRTLISRRKWLLSS